MTAVVLMGCVLAVILIWVAGEEIYSQGYKDGRRDGYMEGIKDGRDSKGQH